LFISDESVFVVVLSSLLGLLESANSACLLVDAESHACDECALIVHLQLVVDTGENVVEIAESHGLIRCSEGIE